MVTACRDPTSPAICVSIMSWISTTLLTGCHLYTCARAHIAFSRTLAFKAIAALATTVTLRPTNTSPATFSKMPAKAQHPPDTARTQRLHYPKDLPEQRVIGSRKTSFLGTSSTVSQRQRSSTAKRELLSISPVHPASVVPLPSQPTWC